MLRSSSALWRLTRNHSAETDLDLRSVTAPSPLRHRSVMRLSVMSCMTQWLGWPRPCPGPASPSCWSRRLSLRPLSPDCPLTAEPVRPGFSFQVRVHSAGAWQTYTRLYQQVVKSMSNLNELSHIVPHWHSRYILREYSPLNWPKLACVHKCVTVAGHGYLVQLLHGH